MKEIYAPSDPTYLQEATAALNQLLAPLYPAERQPHAKDGKDDSGIRSLAS
ncbi:hypothetical protein LFADAHJC_LOCUS2652 [Methylorubrum extorquens]